MSSLGERKVKGGAAAVIMVTAFGLDTLNFVIGILTVETLNFLTGPVSGIILYFIFRANGVSMWSGKNVLGSIITIAIDTTPLNMFAPWTVRSAILIASERTQPENTEPPKSKPKTLRI